MDDFDIRGELNVQSNGVSIRETLSDGTVRQVATDLTVRNFLISGRPVPIDDFERIPEEPLDGEPLGHVNWWFGEHGYLSYENGWRQLIWVNADGEVRRTVVGKEPPDGEDPTEWNRRYEQFTKLRQLYIGD